MMLLLPHFLSWQVVVLAQSSLGMAFQGLHLLVKALAATPAQAVSENVGV
jgi:hypothetical protein